MNIKEILKHRRLELSLTMADVAKAVGVTEATISRWESGDIANMRRDKIAALSNVLQISPSVIMGWEEPKILTFTPDTNPTTQKLLVFNKNGIPGAHEVELPSDDVLNELNKLVKALRPYPAEQIHTLLEIVENGGNLRLNIDLPPEHRELLSVISNLSKENIKTLIQVAKSMK